MNWLKVMLGLLPTVTHFVANRINKKTKAKPVSEVLGPVDQPLKSEQARDEAEKQIRERFGDDA